LLLTRYLNTLSTQLSFSEAVPLVGIATPEAIVLGAAAVVADSGWPVGAAEARAWVAKVVVATTAGVEVSTAAEVSPPAAEEVSTAAEEDSAAEDVEVVETTSEVEVEADVVEETAAVELTSATLELEEVELELELDPPTVKSTQDS
jgi:hypothetical protein